MSDSKPKDHRRAVSLDFENIELKINDDEKGNNDRNITSKKRTHKRRKSFVDQLKLRLKNPKKSINNQEPIYEEIDAFMAKNTRKSIEIDSDTNEESIESLKIKLAKLEKEKQEYKIKLNEAGILGQELLNEINTLTETNQRMELEKSTLLSKINRLETENEYIKQETNELNELQNKLHSEQQSYKSKDILLSQDIIKFQNEIIRLREDIKEWEHDNDVLKEQNIKLFNQIQKLKKNNDSNNSKTSLKSTDSFVRIKSKSKLIIKNNNSNNNSSNNSLTKPNELDLAIKETLKLKNLSSSLKTQKGLLEMDLNSKANELDDLKNLCEYGLFNIFEKIITAKFELFTSNEYNDDAYNSLSLLSDNNEHKNNITNNDRNDMALLWNWCYKVRNFLGYNENPPNIEYYNNNEDVIEIKNDHLLKCLDYLERYILLNNEDNIDINDIYTYCCDIRQHMQINEDPPDIVYNNDNNNEMFTESRLLQQKSVGLFDNLNHTLNNASLFNADFNDTLQTNDNNTNNEDEYLANINELKATVNELKTINESVFDENNKLKKNNEILYNENIKLKTNNDHFKHEISKWNKQSGYKKLLNSSYDIIYNAVYQKKNYTDETKIMLCNKILTFYQRIGYDMNSPYKNLNAQVTKNNNNNNNNDNNDSKDDNEFKFIVFKMNQSGPMNQKQQRKAELLNFLKLHCLSKNLKSKKIKGIQCYRLVWCGTQEIHV